MTFKQGWASKLKYRAKILKDHSTVEPIPIHSTDPPPPPPPPKKKKKKLNITYRKHAFTGSILWGLQIYSTQDNIIPSVDKISLLLQTS